MQHFVRQTNLFLFGVFWGMCGENSCNVFLLLFMALWVPISTALFRRVLVVLALWHAFLFLGLRFFPLFFLYSAWWPPLLFLVKNSFYLLATFWVQVPPTWYGPVLCVYEVKAPSSTVRSVRWSRM
jgi:hypothetical protein